MSAKVIQLRPAPCCPMGHTSLEDCCADWLIRLSACDWEVVSVDTAVAGEEGTIVLKVRQA